MRRVLRCCPGRARRVIALAGALSLSLWIAGAGEVAAQSQPVAPARRAVGREAEQGAKGRAGAGAGALRGSVGVPVAERLLGSGDAEDRLRGIERLGAIGTTEAVDALIEALEQGSTAGRDPRARLMAVRALAPHAAKDSVRQLLTRELTDPAGGPSRGAASPLGEMVRGTAARARARGGA
ncbi:MAG: HEAT repeat domain-containing protein, partial [Polyangiaceae bacterium]|nr:HEAT repeat domain-containing protein [Polyangiaceae bacterium]